MTVRESPFIWRPGQKVDPTPSKPPVGVERVTHGDFSRTDMDAFLEGGGGGWHASYQVEHYTTNPWFGVTEEAVRAALDGAMKTLDLGEELRSVELSWSGSEAWPNAHVRLDLKPGSKLTDREVYAAYKAAWPHEQAAMPSITVVSDVTVESDSAADAPSATPLLGRVYERDGDRMRIRADRLTKAEVDTLKRWATQIKPGSQKQKPARLLLALLSAPTDLSTQDGVATVDALKSLNLFSPFWNDAMGLMENHFGDKTLNGYQFLYNGHPTSAMTSLLPTLRAFGVGKTALWMSNKTGSFTSKEVIKTQKPRAYFARKLVGETRHNLTMGNFIEHALMGGAVSSWNDEKMIVDKSGPWMKDLGGGVPAPVLRGDLRAIVHNRDDIDAIADVRDKIWGVDFANSALKALEATFIGEQYALIGAREVRQAWGERIADVPVFVKGAGLLGGGVIEGLDRLGMDRKNITVIDTDHQVLAKAKAEGFSVRDPRAFKPGDRPERAIVYVATPGVGIDAKSAHDFADDTIVVSLSSGGKGVDIDGLRGAADSVESVPTPPRVAPLKDELMTLTGPDGRTTRLRMVAEGQPPNLVEDMWADRFQVTSLGISIATLTAASLTGPGVVPFNEKLELDLIAAARRHGLLDLRPLDAREGDDPEALRRDLDAFRPA